MKKIFLRLFLLCAIITYAQQKQDSTITYKKRVLENAEINLLTSYYTQDGENAAITGGIGNEHLTDFATDITVAIPLNEDDVLSISATVSAYTSASSSNLDPFSSGASNGGDDDDDDDDRNNRIAADATGSPWVASSGASKSDVWFSTVFTYNHSADNRNKIWSANASFAIEYDYTSVGFGGSHTWLFNQKNTEFAIKANAYLDNWNPRYPTEIDSYLEAGQNLNNGFFAAIDILDQSGTIINKNGLNVWRPSSKGLIQDKHRNTFSASISLSQILSKKAQFSLFLDVVQQEGWLANPSQRIYFRDKDNYYIGNASSIPNYTLSSNTDVFRLADDIERLPNTRFKVPIGMRFNYYINEFLIVKSYYRFYNDDWGINSHTAEIELPIKLSRKFTIYPSYRYYTQTQADYFAAFDTHFSTEQFYTSDYDLSAFNSSQYGFALRYTDILSKSHIGKLNFKQVDLKYSKYQRNSTFKSDIISLGFKYIFK